MAGAFVTGCNNATPAPDEDVPGATKPAASSNPEVVDNCPHGADHACGNEAAPPSADQSHFGQPFTMTETKDLAAVAEGIGDEATVVQVRGKVDKVCRKKGCWMVIRDGDAEARVVTYSGKFLLPPDTEKGREAIVEGRLEPKIVTKKFARHLAEDGGENPEEVKGPKRELHLHATAVALR